MLPDHAPEAEQELAFVEDQARVEDAPLATDAGFATSDTMGDCGGGVDPAQLAGGPDWPPQAAIVRAIRGTSSDVRIRKMRIPIPLNDAANDVRGGANQTKADASPRGNISQAS